MGKRKAGFEVSVSRVFPYHKRQVYDRAIDWLESQDRIAMKSKHNGTKLTCEWRHGSSEVDMTITSKGVNRAQLSVAHRLESEVDADVMRNYWQQHLPRMVESL